MSVAFSFLCILPECFEKVGVEAQVMERCQGEHEWLARYQKVPQISAGVVCAEWAVTGHIYWSQVFAELLVPNIERSVGKLSALCLL